MVDTEGYVPKHSKASPAPRRPSRSALAAGLAIVLVGASAGAFVLRSEPASTRDADTTAVSAIDAVGPLGVCERASLEDRAGLVIVVGLPGVTTVEDPLVDELEAMGVGGVMLRDENIEDGAQVTDLIGGLRGRLGADLLVAVDEEGGRVTSMQALDQPIRSARRLGAGTSEDAEAFGEALGEVAAEVGIDWFFGPVADLDDGPADGVIGDRSFSADPETAATAAAAVARGLHGAGVAVTAKHFPGHGGLGDPHTGRTVDPSTLAELERDDLAPFRRLIDDGADAVMMGHVTYPQVWGDQPASLTPGAYELLRAQGFEGVAITDALGMGAIHAEHGFDVAPALAIAAGADAVLVNQGDQVRVLRDGIVAAVQEGRLDEARLDDAVRRVLTLRGQALDGIVCEA